MDLEARPRSETINKPLYPHPGTFKTLDPPTNLTIDQIITKQLGGIDVAAHRMVAPGEHILAELDMLLSQDQFLNLYQLPSNDNNPYSFRNKRRATRDPLLRWSDGILPYTFALGHFDKKEMFMIKQAMTEWERYTCLKFRPTLSADPNSIRIQNGAGCSSQLGMVGGVQTIALEAPGCRFRGLYLHEIGHAIGLVHEHQRPDRDQYIRVLYRNVAPHMRLWFNMYSRQKVNMFDIDYQYSSIMHYGTSAFSYNGRAQTLQPLDPSREEEIGKVFTKELAFSDVKYVNLMYNCAAGCPKNVRCLGGGYVDQTCKCICPDGSRDCQDGKEYVKDEHCNNLFDDWQCTVWSNAGECDRNKKFMTKNCKKSCELCGSRTDTEEKENHFTTWAWQWFGIFTNIVPKDWIIGVCKDSHPGEKCAKWKHNGDCSTNEWWMSRACKKTCNACIPKDKRLESQCANVHTSVECDKWAFQGECEINPTWMAKNCQSSCKLCHTTRNPNDDDRDDVDTGECEDKHPKKESCRKWAAKGECTANPVWMIPNCRKSCNKCEDGACKNVYEDRQCDIWTSEGQCTKNTKWMTKNCAVSCRKCINKNGKDGGRTGTDTSNEKEGKESACENKHNDVECLTWAYSGHCDINPGWMLVNCRKSCKVCHLKPGLPKVPCIDEERGCAGWAKYGFCETNPRYNLIHCKKSCNNCNGCRDKQYICSVWAKAGHCISNPVYMLRNCQRSCDVCP